MGATVCGLQSADSARLRVDFPLRVGPQGRFYQDVVPLVSVNSSLSLVVAHNYSPLGRDDKTRSVPQQSGEPLGRITLGRKQRETWSGRTTLGGQSLARELATKASLPPQHWPGTSVPLPASPERARQLPHLLDQRNRIFGTGICGTHGFWNMWNSGINGNGRNFAGKIDDQSSII